MDMSKFTIAKSDQLNSDDLVGAPRTITVTGVRGTDASDQPVAVSYEGDDGKPYKPCKSMRRVMVHCWGKNATEYAGRSMTLYCDPDVQFGGMKVGGIRISHMSHITGKKQFALTATRGKKAPYTVLPLTDAPRQAEPAADYTVQLERLRSIAAPGKLAELGDEWERIGSPARKALAGELDALKAKCALPATDDVPFDTAPEPQEGDNGYSGV